MPYSHQLLQTPQLPSPPPPPRPGQLDMSLHYNSGMEKMTFGEVARDRVSVHLDAAQFGISAGQAAVLYDPACPDRVLGGGNTWPARFRLSTARRLGSTQAAAS